MRQKTCELSNRIALLFEGPLDSILYNIPHSQTSVPHESQQSTAQEQITHQHIRFDNGGLKFRIFRWGAIEHTSLDKYGFLENIPDQNLFNASKVSRRVSIWSIVRREIVLPNHNYWLPEYQKRDLSKTIWAGAYNHEEESMNGKPKRDWLSPTIYTFLISLFSPSLIARKASCNNPLAKS